jgi:hypothetical protein
VTSWRTGLISLKQKASIDVNCPKHRRGTTKLGRKSGPRIADKRKSKKEEKKKKTARWGDWLLKCAGSLEEAERLMVHGTDLLKRFNVTLQTARERVYYGLKASATLPETISAEKEEATEGEADSTEGLRKRRRSRVETLMRCSVER